MQQRNNERRGTRTSREKRDDVEANAADVIRDDTCDNNTQPRAATNRPSAAAVLTRLKFMRAGFANGKNGCSIEENPTTKDDQIANNPPDTNGADSESKRKDSSASGRSEESVDAKEEDQAAKSSQKQKAKFNVPAIARHSRRWKAKTFKRKPTGRRLNESPRNNVTRADVTDVEVVVEQAGVHNGATCDAAEET